MAILNSVGKVIGKAQQGISDAAKTVSTAAKETREKKRQEKEDNRVAEQERKAEEARKCPKCGQSFSGIISVCPLCGYEVRNAKTSDAITNLTKEINRLNQKRKPVKDAIASKLSGRHVHPTDEKIAGLIQNFVVPNTKEDIFEFMILAEGYMDEKFLAGEEKESEVADIVIKAWASKFEQTFQKAKLSFGHDKDFSKIEQIYNDKMAAIEAEKAKHKGFSLFRRR